MSPWYEWSYKIFSEHKIRKTSLIHFMQVVSPYTPSKHLKTRGFLMFSRGIERSLAETGL